MVTLTFCGLLVSPVFVTPAAASTIVPITKAWLNTEVVAWKPAHNSSLSFGALYNRASYGNPETGYNNVQVQSADLAMLTSGGPSCIRIDINYSPWLENYQNYINEMTSNVNSIRAQGHCLIIADAGSESYYGSGKLTWSQFEAAWVPRVETLAALYHPDYYIVIKEPGWYAGMVSDATTNPQFQSASAWESLTQTLASAVLSVSPNTKVGVSVAADDLASDYSLYQPYVTGIEKLPDISFIGYDIYTASGFTNTQSFLSTYGTGGKAVWIAEAWSGLANVAFSSSRSTMDKEWMLVLYYFAQLVHAQMVIPFFTDVFASYGTWPTQPNSIISLYQTHRTLVFYEFQSISRSYGVPP